MVGKEQNHGESIQTQGQTVRVVLLLLRLRVQAKEVTR